MAERKDLSVFLAPRKLDFAHEMLAEFAAADHFRTREGSGGIGDEFHATVDRRRVIARRFAFDKLANEGNDSGLPAANVVQDRVGDVPRL